MQNLHHSEVIGQLFSAVPEAKDQYDKWSEGLSEEPLPYTVFGLVLEPFTKAALNSPADRLLLQRIFGFLEKMACSKDIEVVNLLYIGFFETWLGEPEILDHAWKFMGKTTKAVAVDAARRLNQMHNLPQD